MFHQITGGEFLSICRKIVFLQIEITLLSPYSERTCITLMKKWNAQAVGKTIRVLESLGFRLRKLRRTWLDWKNSSIKVDRGKKLAQNGINGLIEGFSIHSDYSAHGDVTDMLWKCGTKYQWSALKRNGYKAWASSNVEIAGSFLYICPQTSKGCSLWYFSALSTHGYFASFIVLVSFKMQWVVFFFHYWSFICKWKPSMKWKTWKHDDLFLIIYLFQVHLNVKK